MKLAIIIPAYNEEKNIASVIKSIPKKISGASSIDIIVVDDSSKDKTATIARKLGAHVISHAMNLGAGGATLTGLIYSQRLGSDAAVSIDGDGQHNPSEIANLLKHYNNGEAGLIIGSRFLSDTIKNMPLLKKIGNRGLSLATYLLCGKMISDTQSGFRLFGRKMIGILSVADLAGYEFCSETIMIAGQNQLVIEEVPISTIYRKGRGGQNPLNGVNILMKLIFRKLTG